MFYMFQPPSVPTTVLDYLICNGSTDEVLWRLCDTMETAGNEGFTD